MLIYQILSILLFPFVEIYIFYRIYKKKEHKQRFRERFGIASKEQPDGNLIWINAVSVGEAKSALILADEILKKSPDSTILFTTTTLTSAEIIEKKSLETNGKIIHQFLPVDLFFQVRKFLRFWQPSTIIFFESEIWPNLITESKKSGANLYLANARISEKSAKIWRFFDKLFFNVFNNFDIIFAQSEDDKNRFQKLTKKEVLFLGNLKSQIQAQEADKEKLESLKTQIENRPIFLASSTHRGEEEIIVKTHQKLKTDFKNILTIIVLRHPNRSLEVEKILQNIKFAKRSKNQNITKDIEIYLVDTIGELETFYQLSDFGFIGGSLVKIGGHNPYEAIANNCAVISGENIFNFKDIYENLAKSNSCILVKNSDELYEVSRDLLLDPNKVKNINFNAKNNFSSSQNLAQKLIEKIDLT